MMGVQLHNKFRYKKDLREACPIAASKVFLETSFFGDEYNGDDGQYVICGPDVNRDRRWYADCKVVAGNIVEVS